MSTPPPIACTLTAPELRLRRAGLLRRVRERVVAMRPLAAEAGEGGFAGFELRFDAAPETVADVLDLVRLESLCCAFLRFRLTIEPAGASLTLEITGPPGGADILADELLAAPPASGEREEGDSPC